MQDDQTGWDEKLSTLDASLQSGDHDSALAHFLAFDAELTRYVRGEERLLFPVLERFTSVPVKATASMRSEHRCLRRLTDTVAELIAREDRPRALSALATLRSVLLLHVAKEQWVLHPFMRPAA